MVARVKLQIDFNDKPLQRLVKSMRASAGNAHADAGVVAPEDSQTAQIAQFHEYGYGVPERSFLRATFADNKKRLAAIAKRKLSKVSGGADFEAALFAALRDIGVEMQRAILKRIQKGIPPPLKEETIKAKKRAGYASAETPLRATGTLMHAIRWRVRSGESEQVGPPGGAAK